MDGSDKEIGMGQEGDEGNIPSGPIKSSPFSVESLLAASRQVKMWSRNGESEPWIAKKAFGQIISYKILSKISFYEDIKNCVFHVLKLF